jgi:hypothetical protein
MASPIPTQLSPGVNVSEIDLSEFVQPQAANSAGMVGVFNWGPGSIATTVSSESELAGIFGKPTLDPSDTLSEDDFLSASNFLRYSNNLKVIRIVPALDANAASLDPGISSISNCTYRIIKNEDEFRNIGGFSASDGIEPIARFRAKYPGNFGNSLKVIVYDGSTAESSSPQYIDYILARGYTLGTTGIQEGTIGYTFSYDYTNGISFDGSVISSVGVTANNSLKYLMITLMNPGTSASAFIDQLSNPSGFSTLYATGTTTANYTLTQNGTNPTGNYTNYHEIEDATLGNGTKYNPFAKYNISSASNINPKNVFARPSQIINDAVDIILIDGDNTNMNYGARLGSTYHGVTAPITRLHGFTWINQAGSPSITHFGELIFNETLFELYRNTWSRVYKDLFNVEKTSPSVNTFNNGWALLAGLTTPSSVNKLYETVNGVSTAIIGLTFMADGTCGGIRQDFTYALKQFGRSTARTSVENKEDFSIVRIFDKVPGTSDYAKSLGGLNDELSIAVIDAGGKFGPKNSVLEKFELLSKAVDGRNLNNENVFYRDYINRNSSYVYLTRPFGFAGGGSTLSTASTSFGDITSRYALPDGITYTINGYYESSFGFGSSSTSNPTLQEKLNAYSIFADDNSSVDILFMQESSVANDSTNETAALERSVYDAVIDKRKDTIFVLPTPKPSSFTQHSSQATSNAINYRKALLNLPPNSYTVLVAGRKLYFDAFNNQIRRMALSSDVAGILSAQEIPWESPAGFSRGALRNVIRLETNYSKTNRDDLYKNQVNTFVEFNDGSGTVLFGDKTLLTKPSAFDRINVRRVFVAIEKAIAKSAKYSLFEFNDEFSRSQFRNLVNPFLATIQAQRGILDFKVVCDETNNTAEVIDKNQFVADIYVKPAKSINFIQLNFIATRSDFNLTTTE